MSAASDFACPWCSFDSEDRTTFRTHLLVEHRKSDVVDFVVDACGEAAESSDQAGPLAQ